MNLNNVIVAELDITVPPLDFTLVEQFCDATKEAYLKSRYSTVDSVYMSRNSRTYPWERRVLERNNKVLYNAWAVFAPVKDVIDKLEVDEDGRSIVMIYQSGQPDYDFNFHFDNTEVPGFRICFGLSDKPFLEFSKVKDEFQKHALNLGKLSADMMEPEVLSFTPSKSNCVLVVNGDTHPHRVPVLPEQAALPRAVFIVCGKMKRFDFPVVQSLEKSL